MTSGAVKTVNPHKKNYLAEAGVIGFKGWFTHPDLIILYFHAIVSPCDM